MVTAAHLQTTRATLAAILILAPGGAYSSEQAGRSTESVALAMAKDFVQAITAGSSVEDYKRYLHSEVLHVLDAQPEKAEARHRAAVSENSAVMQNRSLVNGSVYKAEWSPAISVFFEIEPPIPKHEIYPETPAGEGWMVNEVQVNLQADGDALKITGHSVSDIQILD